MHLLSLWVKAPILKGAHILIVSECLKYVNSKVWESICRGKVVLEACPEREGQSYYGKIASIVRSSRPSKITVVTVDGSPHCLQLHAAVNEAIYILGESIPHEHYVLVDARDLVKISPEAIRVARYLSLVDKLVRENPEILKELEKHSLEYRLALRIGDIQIKI